METPLRLFVSHIFYDAFQGGFRQGLQKGLSLGRALRSLPTKTRKDRRAVPCGFCAAGRGAAFQRSCARRSASGSLPGSGSTTSGFVVPGKFPLNPFSLYWGAAPGENFGRQRLRSRRLRNHLVASTTLPLPRALEGQLSPCFDFPQVSPCRTCFQAEKDCPALFLRYWTPQLVDSCRIPQGKECLHLGKVVASRGQSVGRLRRLECGVLDWEGRTEAVMRNLVLYLIFVSANSLAQIQIAGGKLDCQGFR